MDTDADLRQLLQHSHTIAVVGLSPQAHRPSHGVARYLQSQGYRIVPVNPVVAGEGAQILGEPVYADLQAAADALATQGQRIDMVDCFRRSEEIPPVVEQAIAIGASSVWMQLGVEHEEAAQQARAAGLAVVQDRCIEIEHIRLLARRR